MLELLLVKLLNYLDTLPPLAIILYVLYKRRLRGSFILYFLIIQFIFNLSANVLNEFNYKNLYLYHFNCLFSFLALSLFYNQLFDTQKTRLVIFSIAVVFSFIFFLNMYVWEGVQVFNSNSFGLASFILCGYALYYYLQLFKNPSRENIVTSRDFWFNTGIFSYYTINFFIFLTYKKLTQDKTPLLTIVWQVHNVIFLIMCIYFFIGSLCKISQEK